MRSYVNRVILTDTLTIYKSITLGPVTRRTHMVIGSNTKVKYLSYPTSQTELIKLFR